MVHHQHSQCRAYLGSHISGMVDLSPDVISCQVSKAVKGGGGASLVLVPRKNWFETIYPNDTINIYFSVGTGFHRVFFGYVDRIERQVQVDQSTGATQTLYSVVCTDFTKAIEQTAIYFNPMLQRREDLQGFLMLEGVDKSKGDVPLGGLQLATKGLSAHGSPADMILSLLFTVLGMSEMWVLPKDYPAKFAKQIRRKQEDMVLSKLSNLIGLNMSDLNAAIEAAKVENTEAFNNATGTGVGPMTANEAQVYEIFSGTGGSFTHRVGAAANLLDIMQQRNRGLSDTGRMFLMDTLDVSFVEMHAISGYFPGTPVWDQEGSLLSFLMGRSNDSVNELFFDLRPVARGDSSHHGDMKDEPHLAEHIPYDRTPDEFAGNVQEGFEPAPRYVPALVMREYPFSTIHRFVPGNLTGQEGAALEAASKFKESNLGQRANAAKQPQEFGAVFAVGANQDQPEGRWVVSVPNLRPSDYQGGTIAGHKAIDVVKIDSQDIMQEQLGRDDASHYNFFEMFGLPVTGMAHQKYMFNELIPLVSGDHIVRHGLRRRYEETIFATFGGPEFRRLLVRWALLLDHWNQHNIEYLNGVFTLRGMPWIRAGYRLDITDRNQSFYVENVNHQWQYPNALTTQVQVTRGQPNNPFPVWVPPELYGGVRRTAGSPTRGQSEEAQGRLTQFFTVRSSDAAVKTGGASRNEVNEVDQNVDDSSWAGQVQSQSEARFEFDEELFIGDVTEREVKGTSVEEYDEAVKDLLREE